MMVSLQDLRILAAHAKRIGTMDRWIDVALEWGESVLRENARLKAELVAAALRNREGT